MTPPEPSPTSLPSTLSRAVEHELVVRRSRFLTLVTPVDSPEAADAVVAARRKAHWDARHHCTATVLGARAEVQRSSDDGEPSGTAGVPMLEVLRQRRTTDVVAVVTRYFGGVLLGAGGLVRAYSGAVAAALDVAAAEHAVLRRQVLLPAAVEVAHADAGRLEHVLRAWADAHGAVMQQPVYAEAVHLELLVPPEQVARLRADLATATSGGLAPSVGPGRVVDVARP